MTSGSSVPDVLAQLADIQAEIIDPVSGRAVTTYDNVPYTVAVADMPLFVNFVGALSQNNLAGSDWAGRTFNETRSYLMTLYHSAYGTGVEGENLGLLTPYFALVYHRFGLYPHLSNLGGIIEAKIISDTGATVVQFAGQQYYGIRFTLQVTSKIRRPLGEDE